jgi:hypothetical protein
VRVRASVGRRGARLHRNRGGIPRRCTWRDHAAHRLRSAGPGRRSVLCVEPRAGLPRGAGTDHRR